MTPRVVYQGPAGHTNNDAYLVHAQGKRVTGAVEQSSTGRGGVEAGGGGSARSINT